jgi:hypothetical protein
MSGFRTPIRVRTSREGVDSAAARLRTLYNQGSVTPRNTREMQRLIGTIARSPHMTRNHARLTTNVRQALRAHRAMPRPRTLFNSWRRNNARNVKTVTHNVNNYPEESITYNSLNNRTPVYLIHPNRFYSASTLLRFAKNHNPRLNSNNFLNVLKWSKNNSTLFIDPYTRKLIKPGNITRVTLRISRPQQ